MPSTSISKILINFNDLLLNDWSAFSHTPSKFNFKGEKLFLSCSETILPLQASITFKYFKYTVQITLYLQIVDL